MFVKIDTRQDFKILRPVIPKFHAIMADELGKDIIDMVMMEKLERDLLGGG